MRLLFDYLKRYKKVLGLTLVLATINQFFSLLDPQIFRLIIDNYATKAATLSHDVFLYGVILLLLVESLIRRDLSLTVKERFVQVGIVFLLLLVAFVMYNDLVKTIRPS